jgi:hypothetical protein
VFEGNKGFMETIAGRFEIDWEREDLECVRRTFLKRYNAEIHSQSALEALLELRDTHSVDPVPRAPATRAMRSSWRWLRSLTMTVPLWVESRCSSR